MNCDAKIGVVGGTEEALFARVEMRVAEKPVTRACELMARTETIAACKNLRFQKMIKRSPSEGGKIARFQAALTTQYH